MPEPRLQLYELLEQRGLTGPDVTEKLSKWPRGHVEDLAHTLFAAIPRSADPATSPFDFVSSSQLAGGPHPCSYLGCRSNRLAEVSRFAALYANSVVIPDPVSLNSDVRPDATEVAADIVLLQQIRPLVEAGIIRFSDTTGHVCRDCLAEKLPGAYRSDVESFLAIIDEALLKDSHFRLVMNRGELVFEWNGPPDLLRHGGIIYSVADLRRENAQVLAPLKPRKLNADRLVKSGFLRSFWGHIADDLLMQNWYATACGTSYLTDRSTDLEIINRVSTATAAAINKAVSEAFSHGLPYLGDVSLDVLLRLRKEEGEAFAVYQDSMRRAFKELTEPTLDRARELFADVVLPEVNGIDAAIRRSRSLLWPSLATSAVTAMASVGIGLYTGILPQSFGQIFAAVGGIGAALSAAERVRTTFAVPADARKNRFYFLWRVKQASKKTRR
jgi:hypothetical protein